MDGVSALGQIGGIVAEDDKSRRRNAYLEQQNILLEREVHRLRACVAGLGDTVEEEECASEVMLRRQRIAHLMELAEHADHYGAQLASQADAHDTRIRSLQSRLALEANVNTAVLQATIASLETENQRLRHLLQEASELHAMGAARMKEEHASDMQHTMSRLAHEERAHRRLVALQHDEERWWLIGELEQRGRLMSQASLENAATIGALAASVEGMDEELQLQRAHFEHVLHEHGALASKISGDASKLEDDACKLRQQLVLLNAHIEEQLRHQQLQFEHEAADKEAAHSLELAQRTASSDGEMRKQANAFCAALDEQQAALSAARRLIAEQYQRLEQQEEAERCTVAQLTQRLAEHSDALEISRQAMEAMHADMCRSHEERRTDHERHAALGRARKAFYLQTGLVSDRFINKPLCGAVQG
jgi:hypothetical protein